MTTDYRQALTAQRARVQAAQDALAAEETRLGQLVAAARTDRFPTKDIEEILDWSRELVRRTAADHGWVHSWGRTPDTAQITPAAATERVLQGVTAWFDEGNAALRLQDLAPVAAEVGRSESWLSKRLKALGAEGDYLTPSSDGKGYRPGRRFKARRRVSA